MYVRHHQSSRKDGVAHKLVFKIKGPYRILEKATPSSYWLHSLPFCEGLGRPGRKVKESAARMKKIPSNMVLHKHFPGNIFSVMSRPLENNPLGG